MLRILNDDAVSIRIEPPGPLGEGVEFWLQRTSARQFHQAKRQHPEGNWTLSRLRGVKVLATFQTKLQLDGAECFFVSGCSAMPLESLCARARSAGCWKEFQEAFLDAAEARVAFDALCTEWPAMEPEQVFEALNRTYVVPIGEDPLREWNDEIASATIDGAQAATSTAVLAALADDSVHKELDKAAIWIHLTDVHGFNPRAPNQAAVATIQAGATAYVSEARSLAVFSLVTRPEVAALVGKLQSASPPKAVLVTGARASGKSTTISQIIDLVVQAGMSVQVVRFDRVTATDPDAIGRELGIDESPATALAVAAGDQPSLLVLDQLDAVSLSGRRPELFGCLSQIIDQAKAHPQMSLLLACRSFDIDNDDRLRALLEGELKAERVDLAGLRREDIEAALADAGIDPARLSLSQIELLSVPGNLAALIDAPEAWPELDFATEAELLRRYWEYKRESHG